MIHTFELQVASTGKKITRGHSTKSLRVWQNKMIKKVLRDCRRNEEVRHAVHTGDIITAWINYDSYKQGCTITELLAECTRVFKGLETL